MKIAFDHQTFVKQRYGGISRYVTKLAMHLIDLEHEPKIFAPFHQNYYLSSLPRSAVLGWRVNSKFLRLPLLPISGSLARPAIALWQPNVVHETYYDGDHRSAPKNVPVILTVHDMIHEIFPNEFRNSAEEIHHKKHAIARADHIICISETTKNDLLRFNNVPPGKISVVYHGQDKSEPIDRIHPFADRKPYILFVGTRRGYKNFDRVLAAYASSNKLCQDFKLVAFGSNPFRETEVKRIAELGLTAQNVIHVYGDDQRLAQLYQHADFFIYPSLYEGFGLPPLEAMANSCPVLSSNTSCLLEVIGDAANFFDPLASESIRHSMEVLAYSPTEKEKLIALGSRRILNFTWQKTAQETLSIYQKLGG